MKAALTRGRRTRRLRHWLLAHGCTKLEGRLYRWSVRRGWTHNH